MSDPSESSHLTPPGPVDELVAEVLRGEPGTITARLEELCRNHPDHAEVLRRRVAVLVDAGLVDAPVQVPLPETLGEFRLLEPIGEGGMGVVYRARQGSLQRDVALKLIRPGELRFAGARERFAREVTTIARLSHPGIVPVYAVGEEGGVPYFAMELVRGETLARLLELMGELGRDAPDRAPRGADLDRALAHALGEAPAEEPAALYRGTWEETALRIVRAVAEALEHAHASNVLHRDLKPSNVMLTREGRVMLLDFGLSSVEGSERLTRTGVQVGSFAYMAPELLTDAGSPDRRSDVYSLGVTLYELLAGQLPYRARSLASLRTLALHAHPRSLRRDRARRVSWEAETVCLVAMDVDRARRYASAGAFARDVDNVLAGRPICARRPGPVLRARRFAGRHPAWTAGVALLLVAVPVTWAVEERAARAALGREKALTDEANVALERSLDEVRRQEARADANFVLARDAVDRMLDHLGDVRLRDVPHLATLRRDVLEDALAFHEALVAAEPSDPEQRLEYARSLRRVAEVHALLSEFDEVCAALERARAVLEERIERDGDPRAREELGQVSWRLVEAEGYRGRLGEAIRIGRAARERFLAWGDAGADAPPSARLRLSRLELQLALALQSSGAAEEARDMLVGSVARLRELRARDALVGDGRGLLATHLALLGEPRAYLVRGDRDAEALALDGDSLREALELRRALAAEEPSPDARFAVMEALNSLAGNLFARDRIEEAIGVYGEAREIAARLSTEFPEVSAYQDAVAATDLNLGAQYATLQRYEEAEEPYARAVEAYARLHELRPDQRGLGVRRLIALQSLIDTRWELERITPELLARLDEADALGAELLESESGQGAAMVGRLQPRLAFLRASALVELGRRDEAVEAARALVEDSGSRPRPLFRAATLLAVCAGSAPADADERAAYALEAVDYLDRALAQEPPASLVETWLGADALEPLRADPAFAELLRHHGLERWL